MNHAKSGDYRLAHFFPGITAGLVNGILIIIFQSAYAALIFSGDLAGFVAKGMGLMLFGAFVMGLTVAITSSFYSTVTAPQDAPTAIMALIAANIAATMAAVASPDAVFFTVVSAIAITSLLTGLFLLLLGWFRLGNMIRFIPYPVVGGFLAGTGWILVKGAIRIMGGIAPRFDHLSTLFQSSVFIKWLPGVIFAILLFWGMKKIRHFLVMPVFILAAISLFYLILAATGTSVANAGAQGWLLTRLSGGVVWEPLAFSAMSQANWGVILQQSGNLATIAIISVISLLLNASGLELIAGEEVDLNRELRSTGFANLLSGFGGSSVGYMSLSLTALAQRIGSRSRISGIVSAGLCGLTLFLGAGIAAFFPKPLLGGLLLYLGLTFLVEWLVNAWFRLPKAEYILVVLILLTIGAFGFLQGMLLGILIAVILFVVNYSRTDVVKHALSGRTTQSNVDRAADAQRFLREQGDQLLVLRLQGYIFFGTANNVLDLVKQRMKASHLPPLRYLLLDFRQVSGLDSSALNSFEKMKMLAQKSGITLVFSHLKPGLVNQFELGNVLEKEQSGVIRVFPDLDHGLEWAENHLLAEADASMLDPFAGKTDADFLEAVLNMAGTTGEPTNYHSWIATRLMRYLTREIFEKDEYLIRQDQPPVGIYILESGVVTAQLEEKNGRMIRLRKMRAGTVIGEMSVFLGLPASASVVADQQCTVLHLSVENFNRMEQTDPQVAAAFHKFIARILGERLLNSNKTIQALMK